MIFQFLTILAFSEFFLGKIMIYKRHPDNSDVNPSFARALKSPGVRRTGPGVRNEMTRKQNFENSTFYDISYQIFDISPSNCYTIKRLN